jgi:hypothetical protein
MGRTRDVSKILTSNTSILSLASASTTYQTIAKTGLIELTPLTISVTGGSGSISTTGAVSFTSASAVSLNNVFSSTYDNYRIVVTGLPSTAAQFQFRYRVSSSDDSTTNAYVRQRTNSNNTTISGFRDTTTMYLLGYWNTTLVNTISMDVYNPFLATSTGLYATALTSSDGAQSQLNLATHNQNTSYTGFTIFPDAGTITGTISVYGYNK